MLGWDEPRGPEDSNEVLEYMGMHSKLCPDMIEVFADMTHIPSTDVFRHQ
jgi:hypothetical protein